MEESTADIYQGKDLMEIIEREKNAKLICAKLNHFTDLKSTLITVLSLVKDLGGIEAVSIRLHDQGDYPYYVYKGFPDSFIKKENSLCSRDKNGKRILISEKGGYELDCMCGNIILGQYDDVYPFFSSKGSFWSNNTTALLANTSEGDRQARTRNYCNSCGYESVALIPIKSDDKIIGLIQMNDKRIGMFSKSFIQYIEMIGEQIGLAVENALSFDTIKAQKKELENAYRKLERMQEDLVESRKMAALGNIVAGVAHEINTPVGVGITGITSLLKRSETLDTAIKKKQYAPDDIKDFTRFAIQSGQLVLNNLNRTAELVRTFKQISGTGNTDAFRQTELRPFLRHIADSLKPRLDEKAVNVTIYCDDDLKVATYPRALAQILVNLMTNSIIHGFQNSDHGDIKIKAVVCNGKFELKYQDNGSGINASLLPQIYEPFVTSSRQAGTGLGLSIVHNIVKQTFNGIITCESHVGQGTRFLISMPLVPGDDHGE